MIDGKISCRFSGFGGQGVMLAGVVMGMAAILDGNCAAHTQSYGPEARGGAARSDLVISREEIDSLLVSKPNIIVALSQEAYDKYAKGKDYDFVFIDTSIVQTDIAPSARNVMVPMTKLAYEKLGSRLAANMLMLGVVNGVTKVVSARSLKEAVKRSVPEATLVINTDAVDLGLSLAAEFAEKYPSPMK